MNSVRTADVVVLAGVSARASGRWMGRGMATNANSNGHTDGSRWLTVAQVAEYLGLTPATLYRWRSAGFFPPCVELRKHILIDVDDLETWLVGMRREGNYKGRLR